MWLTGAEEFPPLYVHIWCLENAFFLLLACPIHIRILVLSLDRMIFKLWIFDFQKLNKIRIKHTSYWIIIPITINLFICRFIYMPKSFLFSIIQKENIITFWSSILDIKYWLLKYPSISQSMERTYMYSICMLLAGL